MGERIRWALHSLCQATLEAVTVPLPRLCRGPHHAYYRFAFLLPHAPADADGPRLPTTHQHCRPIPPGS